MKKDLIIRMKNKKEIKLIKQFEKGLEDLKSGRVKRVA